MHDDYATFRDVYDAHVTVPVPDDDVRAIWQQEHESGGFAVNGELSVSHWQAQMDLYAELNPDFRRVSRDELIAEPFVADALQSLGRHDADFDRTGA